MELTAVRYESKQYHLSTCLGLTAGEFWRIPPSEYIDLFGFCSDEICYLKRPSAAETQ